MGTALSVKVSRACQQLTQQRGAIDEPSGDNVHDALLALQLSLNLEKPRLDHWAALLPSNTLPDDHVDLPALVLERQECNSVGALRTLAHEHYAGGSYHPAVCNTLEIRRGEQPVAHQP